MRLADQQFVLVTTFKKSGEGVATPVWITPLVSGECGFTTSTSTWKVKRLRRDPRVTVQACGRMGEPLPGAPIIGGTGRVVTSGPELAEVRAGIRAKYGVQVAIVHGIQSIVSRVRRTNATNDAAVVLSLEGAA